MCLQLADQEIQDTRYHFKRPYGRHTCCGSAASRMLSCTAACDQPHAVYFHATTHRLCHNSRLTGFAWTRHILGHKRLAVNKMDQPDRARPIHAHGNEWFDRLGETSSAAAASERLSLSRLSALNVCTESVGDQPPSTVTLSTVPLRRPLAPRGAFNE